MKALIMAAGMGTRMNQVHGDIPKGTIPIGDSSILLNMIKALNGNGFDSSDIIIVGGYKCDMIRDHVKDKAIVVYNPFYDVSDDIVSLWVAQEYMIPSEGFIYFHGDTIFGKEFISKLVQNEGERVMLVEKKDECDEEDSKVIVDGDKVLRVSKKVPLNEAFGEFSGTAKFSGEGVKSFIKHINKVVEEKGRKNYESETIQSMIDAGEKVEFILTEGIPFCEIDFPKDLEYALANKEKFGL